MKVSFYITAIMVAAAVLPATADIYDPPVGFYDTATGTGATLKSQLESIMTAGQVQRSYGNFRFASALLDQDPNNANNLLEVYNRASVPGVWDCPNGNCVWNREHVWPQSRQPGSANNSSTGNLGDPLALRPANPGINSNRGNLPFGNFSTTGNFSNLGSFFFPGDADKGDIARSLFYSATRYQSTGLVLVNGVPSGNQMGDLQSLLRWHYTDPPDDFERRRNQFVFSSSLNPVYFTNNRNAYIDRPEFVWSVFGGGSNDSKLYLGTVAPADGASTLTTDLGLVIVNGTVPAAVPVTLNKDGLDPTYYSVTASAPATSTVNGRYNAFDFNPQTTSISVGLAASTAAAGQISGTVTIDNLDVDGAATGQGSLDGNDVITVDLTVLDHSEASFTSPANSDSLLIDFGTLPMGSGVVTQSFDIHNLETTPGFTAGLDLDAISGTGQTATLFTDLAPFSALGPGTMQTFIASFDTSTMGTFSATYTLSVSDENVSGALSGTDLTLVLSGQVVSACDACDANCDGLHTIDDVTSLINLLIQGGVPCSSCAGDANFDMTINAGDIQSFVDCLLGP